MTDARVSDHEPRFDFDQHSPTRSRPGIYLCFVSLLRCMAQHSRLGQSLAREGIPQPSPGVVELMRLQARMEKILGQVQPVARVLNPPNEYTSSTSSA